MTTHTLGTGPPVTLECLGTALSCPCSWEILVSGQPCPGLDPNKRSQCCLHGFIAWLWLLLIPSPHPRGHWGVRGSFRGLRVGLRVSPETSV